MLASPRSKGLQEIIRGPQLDDAFQESGVIITLELQTDTLFTSERNMFSSTLRCHRFHHAPMHPCMYTQILGFISNDCLLQKNVQGLICIVAFITLVLSLAYDIIIISSVH